MAMAIETAGIPCCKRCQGTVRFLRLNRRPPNVESVVTVLYLLVVELVHRLAIIGVQLSGGRVLWVTVVGYYWKLAPTGCSEVGSILVSVKHDLWS